MWIARDKSNSLNAYISKPIKDEDYYLLDPCLLPEVKLEDDEPTEVEIIIKK